jgi:hypothetical protein
VAAVMRLSLVCEKILEKGAGSSLEVNPRFEVREAKANHFEHSVCTQHPLGNDDAVLREEAHRGYAVAHVAAHRACARGELCRQSQPSLPVCQPPEWRPAAQASAR